MDKSLYDCVECAVPHKCEKEKSSSKKCAQCEIDYNFIACEPISLKCGHYICKECTEKVESRSYKCKICSSEMVNTNASGTASEFLVNSSLKM